LAAGVLFLGQIVPEWSPSFDKIGALLLAIVMILLGIRSIRENGAQLMDRIPEPHYFDKVKRAAMGVSGVRDTEKTKIQLYGPDAHVAIDIEVDPRLQVDQAHLISQKVRDAIFRELPEVKDVIVHIEPYYPGDHR
jgi:divalent metal cation (Fe/Co/Zn/Cd) transporter